MFGSVRRLAFISDDMSISFSSWRKLFIAVSLITLVLTYFFRFIVFSEIPRFTTHDRWFAIWLSIMEDEVATCLYGEFCRIFDQWSCMYASQIWWEMLFWEINYLYKSSRKIRQIFRVHNLKLIYGEIAYNRCIRVFALKCFYYRRELCHKLLYIHIIIVIMRLPPLISMNMPSQLFELVYKFRIL